MACPPDADYGAPSGHPPHGPTRTRLSVKTNFFWNGNVQGERLAVTFQLPLSTGTRAFRRCQSFSSENVPVDIVPPPRKMSSIVNNLGNKSGKNIQMRPPNSWRLAQMFPLKKKNAAVTSPEWPSSASSVCQCAVLT